MIISHQAFYAFNEHPERISHLKYLFFKEPKELEINYCMADIYARMFFKSKKHFRNLANTASAAFVLLLESLILRCTYNAFFNVSLLAYFTLSIPFSITLLAAFFYSSFSTMSTYITFVSNCKFIELRIKDLTSKMELIVKSFTSNYLRKRLKKRNRKIYKIMFQMDSILKFRKANQYLANRSFNAFYLAILLIFLFYPYMMFFAHNDPGR